MQESINQAGDVQNQPQAREYAEPQLVTYGSVEQLTQVALDQSGSQIRQLA